MDEEERLLKLEAELRRSEQALLDEERLLKLEAELNWHGEARSEAEEIRRNVK